MTDPQPDSQPPTPTVRCACDWPGCDGRCHTGDSCPCHPADSQPPTSEPEWTVLANDIRIADGDHILGAGELAARLVERGWTRVSQEAADRTPPTHDERTCPDCSRVIEETGGNYLPSLGATPEPLDGWELCSDPESCVDMHWHSVP